MRIVTLDFETYWNSKDKYTLTKMGPIEYIRDPHFFVQCVGFRIDRGQTHVVSYKNGLDRQVLNALHLDEPGTITVGHNINGFDALILSEHYGIKPYMIVDTISLMNWLGLSRVMSCSHKTLTATLDHGIKRAGTVVSDGKRTIEEFTPEEWQFFMQYCSDDVTQCSENFYSMLPYVKNPDALKLMSITAKMGTEPAFIPDGSMLKDYVNDLDSAAEQKRQELVSFLHFDTVDAMLKAIRSRKEFPVLLESLGCPCPMKFSEKQGKEIPAISKTDLEFTKLLNHENPQVRALVSARLEHNSSIQKSRSESLLNFSDKPIPIMLGVFKAHTGRYTAGNEGKSDGLNFQNLSKRDPTKLVVREAIKAPEGYKVVACDSSQIEARILAWVSGQNDLVEQFRTGRDPYAEMASKIFGQTAQEIHDGAKRNDHPEHNKLKMERNVGKTAVLQLGYSSSAQKFSETLLRSDIKLDENMDVHNAQAQRAHAVYRASNPCITTLWKYADNVIRYLANVTECKEYGRFGAHNEFRYGRAFIPCTQINCAYIELPNSYRLWYPNLRFSDGQLMYDRLEHGKTMPSRIYGGKVVENCIAKGTKVLTNHGWKAIELVNSSDLVWDGVEFVPHKGVKSKGIQQVINVNGVLMTEDHLVMEQGEWRHAKITERPDRAEIWQCRSNTSAPLRHEESLLAVPLRLWRRLHTLRCERNQSFSARLHSLLPRLHEEKSSPIQWHSQNVKDKNIWCLAQHGTKMYRTYSSGLEKLWWSWHNCMRRMAQVREFLCRYGKYLSRGLVSGQNRQYEGILQGELSLGYISGECQQHTFFQPNTNNGEMQRTWNKSYDCLQQDEKRMARGYAVYKTGQKQCQATSTGKTDLQQEVFDIIECGPRHRFVVQGNYPMTVHNCCQSYAFMMLGWQACRMADRGINLKANIHDAWITVVPEDKAEETKRIMEEVMSSVPSWLEGFPVGCEAEIGDDFRIA